ncbi:hypothetical protein IMZ08_17880 [Bacillus luteolus]|uniref:ATP synthase F0 subunit 8 n=1 Tax=Litchfieldia luteola TaxID=682179 RepID=A0ABR9QN20_9BACI|nr:hypothetical protein [Cytobacillus luteolus]MBE4909908.1 hypothetical protein [Cytobacillus luteolus]MBP1942537.1 hypothetical protein [Cytobacillus luteolus]
MMWYFIGVPVISVLLVSVVVDIRRRKKQKRLGDEQKSAKDLGDVHAQRGANTIINEHKRH